ncbi:non-specific lipid-transfer protein A-like [Hevea brasiliensis]|uniref:non-specific lipid-transfer protein A-like n=1 Tax=Hevea brasiliensis TaxID=3981 RepID=UPI0025CBE105|nr:non-specific lipid-transfer protein A-like [Hevea brasiliensis]
MKGIMIFVLAVIAMVQFMVMPGESVRLSCGQVNSLMAGCLPYLTGATNNPSAVCCSGTKNLQGLAETTADKRAACNCLKTAAINNPNIRQDTASNLPSKCGVPLNIPIRKDIDCSSINMMED